MSTFRKCSSTRTGSNFSDLTIQMVWNKGTAVSGFDPAEYRKDTCGAWMQRSLYGNVTPGGNGWEIDHIYPVALGGSDDLGNLQPLQWQNNRSKGDGLLKCAIRAAS